ncbi:MAG: hypothetical protein EHM65_11615, partial [Acidobacteriales bacterium]
VFYIIKRSSLLKSNAAKSKVVLSDLLIRIFNYLILALVLLFFIGQTFPLTSELIAGSQITWSAEQYELNSSPLLFLLLIVTAFCPLSSLYETRRQEFWRDLKFTGGASLFIILLLATSRKISYSDAIGFFAVIFLIINWLDPLFTQYFYQPAEAANTFQNKGRFMGFGTILVHIGLGLIGLGIMGQEALSETYEIKMTDGEHVNVGEIQLSIQESRQFISSEGTTFSEAKFLIYEERDGDFDLMPDLEYYPKMEILYARPAISSNLKRDVQIILNNWKDSEDGKFGVHITLTPLMIWIWLGGITMYLGGTFTLIQQSIFRKKK